MKEKLTLQGFLKINDQGFPKRELEKRTQNIGSSLELFHTNPKYSQKPNFPFFKNEDSSSS